jgi:hypothetical protein
MQDPEVQLFMPSLRAELAFGPANLGVPREEILRRSQEALALVRLEGLENHNPRDCPADRSSGPLAAVLTVPPPCLCSMAHASSSAGSLGGGGHRAAEASRISPS